MWKSFILLKIYIQDLKMYPAESPNWRGKSSKSHCQMFQSTSLSFADMSSKVTVWRWARCSSETVQQEGLVWHSRRKGWESSTCRKPGTLPLLCCENQRPADYLEIRDTRIKLTNTEKHDKQTALFTFFGIAVWIHFADIVLNIHGIPPLWQKTAFNVIFWAIPWTAV